MERYLRESGFSSVHFPREWRDFVTHIEKGRPLIASIQPGGKSSLALCVVVGIEQEHEAVLLNDPERGKLFAWNVRNLKKNGPAPTIGRF